MNKQLHTVDHVRQDSGIRIIDITIQKDGVIVRLDTHNDENYHARYLDWEQLTNVELISTMFDQETVRTFKVLAERLGSIAADRDIYQCIA